MKMGNWRWFFSPMWRRIFLWCWRGVVHNGNFFFKKCLNHFDHSTNPLSIWTWFIFVNCCVKPKTWNLQEMSYGSLIWYEAISWVLKETPDWFTKKIATVQWFLTMQCGYVELSSQLCCLCTLGQQFLGCFGMITIWHPAPGSTTKGNMQKPNSL